MVIELTKEEANLTKMLLKEELLQVNELINLEEGEDKKNLIAQALMMKSIIDKL